MPKPSTDRKDPDSKHIAGYATAGAHLSAGVQFAATIALGLFAGWWLDERWSMSPLFLVSGTIFGAVGGFYHLYRTLTPPPPEPPVEEGEEESQT